ncbi:hypothetical protein LCGC14_1604400 [marine sediment metagenome]|uniref:Uncharacterized protein n=1 Tax=marine sediment metagenome TaxID=412755 RepID=A0A0F9IWT9_9ZZZZ
MDTKTRLTAYATSLVFAAIVAFGVGHNEIVDTLILVGAWILILVGVLSTIIGSVILFKAGDAVDDRDAVDDKIIQNWKDAYNLNWFTRISLAAVWLSAFVHVGWHITAVVYFIQVLIIWLVTHLLFQMINDLNEKKDESLDFIKTPEVKDAILKSRKPIAGLDD